MKRTLIIIFAISLFIRVFYLGAFKTYQPHYGMSVHYAELAYMLASGQGYRSIPQRDFFDETLRRKSIELAEVGKKLDSSVMLPFNTNITIAEYWRPPGYPVFLLILYKIFGEPLFLYACLAQALIGSFLPIVVYLLALRLFNRETALLSSFLSALYPPLVFIQLQPLPDGFLILFIILALYCFVLALDRQRDLPIFVLIGIIAGFGFMFRPEIIILLPIFSLTLFVVYKFRFKVLKDILAMGLSVAILLVPWVYRNYKETGFCYLTTGAGGVAWLGIAERENKWGAVLQDEHAHQLARDHGFDSAHAPDADKWLRQKVKEAFKENPMFFVKNSIYRIPEVIATPFHWGYINPARTKGFRSHFRLKENLDFFQTIFRNKLYILRAFWERLITAFISLIATLSMIFMAIIYRHDPKKVILFLSITVSFMLLRVGIRSLPRYLTMLIPFQLMALSFMFFEVKAYFSRKRSL